VLTYSLNYDSISLDEDGGEKMPVIDTSKLSDAQTVANKLTGLPKEALLYIAGYAEGCRDKPTRKRRKKERTNGESKSLQ
jgi:hypothetical protein